ncbi:MAG: RDD family protein, partial [Thermodesulfobacteriota bacterium]
QNKKWYFEKDNKPTGPISESNLVDIIDSGEIKRDTLLWTDSMQDWSPASQVQQFSMHFPPIPPPLPSEKKEIKKPNTTSIPFISNLPKEEDANQIRPWVRYFARFFDISIFSILLGIIIGIINPKFTDGYNIIFVLIPLLLWVFVEPIFLSSYAVTPGKYFLNTRVVDSIGINLTYYAALKRSCKVWFLGLACGIPLISLITLAAAHHKLTKTGKTTWDEDGNFIVEHKKIGQFKMLTFITLMIIILILIFWARTQQY